MSAKSWTARPVKCTTLPGIARHCAASP